jgi:hypothetical protein
MIALVGDLHLVICQQVLIGYIDSYSLVVEAGFSVC